MGGTLSNHIFHPPSNLEIYASTFKETIHTKLNSEIGIQFMDNNSKITILYSHGNAQDMLSCRHFAYEMQRRYGVNVLLYDYTGYGMNSNTPSEAHCYADIEAVCEYLIQEIGTKVQNIILYGLSLGSGPTCHLAKQLSDKGTPCGGVILQSAFASIYRCFIPFRFSMPGDLFCNVDKIPSINCPILIMHGKCDLLVPISHAEDLYLAIQPKYRVGPFFVDTAAHNNILTMWSTNPISIDEALIQFFKQIPAFEEVNNIFLQESTDDDAPIYAELDNLIIID